DSGTPTATSSAVTKAQFLGSATTDGTVAGAGAASIAVHATGADTTTAGFSSSGGAGISVGTGTPTATTTSTVQTDLGVTGSVISVVHDLTEQADSQADADSSNQT